VRYAAALRRRETVRCWGRSLAGLVDGIGDQLLHLGRAIAVDPHSREHPIDRGAVALVEPERSPLDTDRARAREEEIRRVLARPRLRRVGAPMPRDVGGEIVGGEREIRPRRASLVAERLRASFAGTCGMVSRRSACTARRSSSSDPSRGVLAFQHGQPPTSRNISPCVRLSTERQRDDGNEKFLRVSVSPR